MMTLYVEDFWNRILLTKLDNAGALSLEDLADLINLCIMNLWPPRPILTLEICITVKLITQAFRMNRFESGALEALRLIQFNDQLFHPLSST